MHFAQGVAIQFVAVRQLYLQPVRCGQHRQFKRLHYLARNKIMRCATIQQTIEKLTLHLNLHIEQLGFETCIWGLGTVGSLHLGRIQFFGGCFGLLGQLRRICPNCPQA